MVIEKLSVYTRELKRFSLRSFVKCKKEAETVFVKHTPIGRRLRAGFRSARQAVKKELKPISEDNFFDTYSENLRKKGYTVYQSLSKDKEFVELYNKYAEMTGLQKISHAGKTNEQIFQEMIEASGVGPTKFAQIISSDEKIMSKIQTPELKAAIKNVRSHCSFSRTVEEAQELLNKSFPGQGFVIEKELSAGSIGAAYLVKRPDGSTAVLKMLKKGVCKEQLELEEPIFTRLIKELGGTPEEIAKHQSMLKNMYKDWAQELNFFTEYSNNKLLAKGAQRFKVADITNISDNGSCIIMDMAKGVKMEELIEMLKVYKTDPAKYFSEYASKIEKYPWLSKPDKVANELPKSVLKAFDEQFMFLKHGVKSIMHGDPHIGNYFINVDKNGRLIPEFIDTGSCVLRSSAQVKEDIKFFTNYFVGNSEGVAKYFVDQCAHSGNDKPALIKKITEEIQNEIFAKKQNITNFETVQVNINAILERNGLKMSSENATAMKAQMQFFTAINEASAITGKTLDIATILKDIPQASWSLLKTGTNPWGGIKDAIRYAYRNQQQALGTAYQFSISDVNKVLTNGTLEALC